MRFTAGLMAGVALSGMVLRLIGIVPASAWLVIWTLMVTAIVLVEVDNRRESVKARAALTAAEATVRLAGEARCLLRTAPPPTQSTR